MPIATPSPPVATPSPPVATPPPRRPTCCPPARSSAPPAVSTVSESTPSIAVRTGSSRVFDRDNLARRFLSVARRLDALQPPPVATTRREGLRSAEDEGEDEDAVGFRRLLELFDSPQLVHDVIHRNERFRPSERVAAASSSASATLRDSARPAAAATTLVSPPTTKRVLHRTHSTNNANDAAKNPPSASTEVPVPVYVAVGGKARVLPSAQLERVKAALHKRSNALANIQPAAPTSPELRKALRAAPGSTWEALRSSAPVGNPGASVDSNAVRKSSESSSKQALIAELVGRTNFSTLHIFQMSRKFKAIAGAAKSVIAFEEFRQIMSDDMGELLGELEQDSATDSSPSRSDNATHELRAIGATIAASDTFLRRLFLAFDMDGDGKIDIREFVVGLNSFARGAPEEKVAALFEIYRSDSVPPGKGPPRVAISDLLGLFQGDRQLYQELMRCVDDYFVRVEMRDETTISEDEFVAISLEEPHLLDNISRPLPSRRYASDDRVRELVRAYIEQTRLNWRRLLHTHRALVAWARQKRAAPSISLVSSSPQHSTSSAPSINALEDDLQSIVLPVSDFHALLRGGDTGAVSSNGQARPIPDDSLVQSLLLAYMASPRDGDSGSNATKGALVSQKRPFCVLMSSHGDGNRIRQR